jgi:hypothetical protein
MEAMSAGAAPPETAASHEAREVLFAPPFMTVWHLLYI